MSQAQVPPKARREADRADPHRWADGELLALGLELAAVAALTPPFLLALALVAAIAAGALWFAVLFGAPKP